MSSHIVEVCTIDKVEKHPNADRLDIVTVKGWQCVTGNGEYRKGDKCIYIPIDSVLPQNLINLLFPPDSKVRPHNGRIKTIKLRGAVSQGMVVKPEVLKYIPELLYVGQDLATNLKITKYEPPAPKAMKTPGVNWSRKQCNPNFHKYTDIENYKNFNTAFVEGEEVVITEKIHGTNFRAGYVPSVANTLWKRIRKLLGFLPAYEFVYGSRNVQLQDRGPFGQSTFYETNVYAECVSKYDLRRKLSPGQVVYGEIYGDCIQANYIYGCKKGERKLVVFDLMGEGRYLPPRELAHFLSVKGLPGVPVLYAGVFSEAKAKELAKGPSALEPSQKIREGVVVKPIEEATCYFGRKVLKVINDDYLLKADTTDFH